MKNVGGICGGTLLSVIGACQSQDWASHHPWRIISPFNSTSTPCFWKITMHPTSNSSLMMSKLCYRFFRRKAQHAGWGGFVRLRCIVVSVVMFPLLGMVRQKFCSWMVATSACVRSGKSDVDTTELMKAVANKLLGLLKLGLVVLMVLNKLSTALQATPPTGLSHCIQLFTHGSNNTLLDPNLSGVCQLSYDPSSTLQLFC